LIVCSWNIARSLNKKLTNYDFEKKLYSFHLLFLTECLWKDIDTEVYMYIEGFCGPIISCRKKMRGGNIVLFFRKCLKNYICVGKASADAYLWIRVDKLATGYCRDGFFFVCFFFTSRKYQVV
jgi:hypothetical protein